MLTPITPNAREYASITNRLGWALVIFLALFQTITGTVELLMGVVGAFTDSRILLLVDGILSPVAYMAPFIIGGVMFYVLSRRINTQRVRFEVKLPRIFPLWIFAGLAINTAAAYLNGWFCDLIGYTMPIDLLTQQYDGPAAVIMYMTIGLAPAFAEEFLFRGVVYGNLRPFGRTQAIIVSALTFALMHQNIGQLFYTFVCGVVMALMYEWTGSIWCGILFHLFNNELSVLIEVLCYGRFGATIQPYLYLWDGLILLLGTVSIVILILYKRREASRIKQQQEAGIFGSTDAQHFVEEFDMPPVSVRTTLRVLCTPGMIVFAVASVASMLSTLASVYLIKLGGLA
ncbi:MAG: CPBP family intramembrane metalloprotease [Clostridia bacterium]|nr:CPBP family intramembrane metalloprotease [Clostridia bacterium]